MTTAPVGEGRDVGPADRRLRRHLERALIGGVCVAVGEYFGADILLVRVMFVVAALAGGVGAAVYFVCWALIPAAPDSAASTERRRFRDRAWREAAAIVVLVGAALAALRHFGAWPGDPWVGLLALGAAGVALMGRGADSVSGWSPKDLRHPVARLRSQLRPGGPAGSDAPRVLLGMFLIFAAAFTLLQRTGVSTGKALVGLAVILVIVSLVAGPWLARLGRSLADERGERIRSQERADVAAHLHDSVLQTLALIQKRAADPQAVATLARRQERELRDWLLDGSAAAQGTLGAALLEAAAELEEAHGVPIEVVAVGDCELDERLGALVAAAREALANAARFSGAERVDLYLEADARHVEVFVRDRGAGFDLEQVPPDRRGVRESIVARMARHGGEAEVVSAPGAGTEVRLALDRTR